MTNINIKSLFGTLFRQSLHTNAALQLIVVNVGVFFLFKIVNIIAVLFNLNNFEYNLGNYLYVSAAWPIALRRTWTFITYMFFHADMWHLFFNMCCLYWFGNFAQKRFTATQFRWIYFVGGLIGALAFIFAYNIFPYFEYKIASCRLLGASGAVMAIIVASAISDPNYRVRILFLGEIKMKWIAVITVLVSMLGVTGENAGGDFCHIGGALGGLCMALLMVNNSNLFAPIKKLFAQLRHKTTPHIVTEEQQTKFHYVKSSINEAPDTNTTANNDAELDAILDKIRQSGYSSLTNEEKQRLFAANK